MKTRCWTRGPWAYGAFLMIMGCTGETIEPGRGANHPANPNAAEAPLTPPGPTSPAVVTPGGGAPTASSPPHSHGMPPSPPPEAK